MSDDPDGKGDRFDTRAAAVLAHCGYDIDAALPAHAVADLQDEIAAAIRHEAVTAERLSAANAELAKANVKALNYLTSDYFPHRSRNGISKDEAIKVLRDAQDKVTEGGAS